MNTARKINLKFNRNGKSFKVITGGFKVNGIYVKRGSIIEEQSSINNLVSCSVFLMNKKAYKGISDKPIALVINPDSIAEHTEVIEKDSYEYMELFNLFD